jgi:CubicO group peptidase (beta-lactamase class C family)
MKNKILFGILPVSALLVWVVTASAAPTTPADMTPALEAIRNKHDLPALAVVVAKDGQICDRVAVGVVRLRRSRCNGVRVPVRSSSTDL